MTTIHNRTYDQITVGESATLTRTVTRADVEAFAAISGDRNPAHLDDDYARSTPFGEVIAHGMFSGALISAVLGMQLPGPGTIYLDQSLRFRRPVKVGDTLTVTLTCREKHEKRRVTLDCEVRNQNGEVVTTGSATVIAPEYSVEAAIHSG
ncbi:MaoC/PaaZ C-terminal domain-containing protein [Viridibacterium curvum]|uniref:MaoC-like domain-containing protein n=1 Tax=Viridibacterium curvum TaxID=1101404 RepID=A0ABP9Q6I1_9RHOO